MQGEVTENQRGMIAANWGKLNLSRQGVVKAKQSMVAALEAASPGDSTNLHHLSSRAASTSLAAEQVKAALAVSCTLPGLCACFKPATSGCFWGRRLPAMLPGIPCFAFVNLKESDCTVVWVGVAYLQWGWGGAGEIFSLHWWGRGETFTILIESPEPLAAFLHSPQQIWLHLLICN